MTRLPSLEIVRCVELLLGSVIGFSRLATHTVVKTGILLNHMPRYQFEYLGEVVLSDLLVVLAGLNWKKPSANLPFLDTSLSPTTSAWPAVRVSFAVAEEHEGVCKEDKRRRPSSMQRGGGMEKMSVSELEMTDALLFGEGRR